MTKDEIDSYFPEFLAVKNGCKFNNCLHTEEPKCAVKEAVEDDRISFSRYKSYLQIIAGEEEHYRTDFWENEEED